MLKAYNSKQLCRSDIIAFKFIYFHCIYINNILPKHYSEDGYETAAKKPALITGRSVTVIPKYSDSEWKAAFHDNREEVSAAHTTVLCYLPLDLH